MRRMFIAVQLNAMHHSLHNIMKGYMICTQTRAVLDDSLVYSHIYTHTHIHSHTHTHTYVHTHTHTRILHLDIDIAMCVICVCVYMFVCVCVCVFVCVCVCIATFIATNIATYKPYTATCNPARVYDKM